MKGNTMKKQSNPRPKEAGAVKPPPPPPPPKIYGGHTMKKHPITIVLTEDTHKALKKRAEEESRPVAQMARVIIEKELKGEG